MENIKALNLERLRSELIHYVFKSVETLMKEAGIKTTNTAGVNIFCGACESIITGFSFAEAVEFLNLNKSKRKYKYVSVIERKLIDLISRELHGYMSTDNNYCYKLILVYLENNV